MTYKEIQDLIKLINKTDLAEVRIKEGEFSLLVKTKHYQDIKKSAPETITTMPLPAQVASSPAPPSVAAPAPAASAPAATIHADEGQAEETQENLLEIKSPIVGTFYRSASPDKPAYVKVGDKVESGSVVCIVEAMKLFNEIESEVSGTIVKVMVEDASPVEYDQVLYLVDPS